MNIFGKKPIPSPNPGRMTREQVEQAHAKMRSILSDDFDSHMAREMQKIEAVGREGKRVFERAMLPDSLSEDVRAQIEAAHDVLEEMHTLVDEQELENLEMERIVQRGFREEVVPLDRRLATNAANNLRDLEKFQRDSDRQDAEWAREDAAEGRRRR